MTNYNRILLRLFAIILAAFSSFQLQAQLGTGNWPCMPQSLNNPPELVINDLIINGQSVYGLSHVPMTPGTTYNVEMYFTAGGGPTNTDPIYTKVHMDVDMSGTYDAGEMIASPAVPPLANSGYVQFPMTVPAAAGDAALAFVMDYDEPVAMAPPCLGNVSFVSAYTQIYAKVKLYNQLLAVSADPDPQTIFNGTMPVMPQGALCVSQRTCECFQDDFITVEIDVSPILLNNPQLINNTSFKIKVGLKEQELVLNSQQVGSGQSFQVPVVNWGYDPDIPDCVSPEDPEEFVWSDPMPGFGVIDFGFPIGVSESTLPHAISSSGWGSNAPPTPTIPPYLRMPIELWYLDPVDDWQPVGLVTGGKPVTQANANSSFELNLWYCYQEGLQCADDEGGQGNGRQAAGEAIGQESTSAFAVYPNPSNGLVHVDYTLTQKGSSTFHIVDVQGRTLMSVNKGTQLEGSYHDQIDLSSLPRGIYLLQHISKDGVKVERILKE